MNEKLDVRIKRIAQFTIQLKTYVCASERYLCGKIRENAQVQNINE